MSMSVCLFLCLKTTLPNFTKVFVRVNYLWLGGVVIRYVLPVLCMTSSFHVMVLWHIMHILKRQ